LTAVTPTAAPLDSAPARKFGLDLSTPVLLAFVAILVVLIVVPMAWLVVYAFTNKAGVFTVDNFTKLFTDSTFLEPLLTTLTIATSVGVVCCLVAAPIAWLVARTDMPLRGTAVPRRHRLGTASRAEQRLAQ
jgi:iron(III) transport system permease protein